MAKRLRSARTQARGSGTDTAQKAHNARAHLRELGDGHEFLLVGHELEQVLVDQQPLARWRRPLLGVRGALSTTNAHGRKRALRISEKQRSRRINRETGTADESRVSRLRVARSCTLSANTRSFSGLSHLFIVGWSCTSAKQHRCTKASKDDRSAKQEEQGLKQANKGATTRTVEVEHGLDKVLLEAVRRLGHQQVGQRLLGCARTPKT